jgi:AraC-like DNA-binding protein
MQLLLRHKLLVAAVTVLALGSGGIAYAATQSSSNPRQAFLNDVAKRLNVSPAKLNSAFKAALVDRLNAEVKAGKITQAQANRIEQRLDRSGAPPFFFGRGGRFRMGRPARFESLTLSAAASYLGVSDAQLMKDLGSGKSMADVAKASGKSVSGLEQAIVSAEKTQLDGQVTKGTITKAQEQQILSRLSARVDALVNGTGFRRPRMGLRVPSLKGRGPAPENAPMMVAPYAPPPGPSGPPPGPTA